MTIEAGRDKYRSVIGSWEIMASEVLVKPVEYSPDYNAWVSSEKLRCLRISRGDYQNVLQGKTLKRMDTSVVSFKP